MTSTQPLLARVKGPLGVPFIYLIDEGKWEQAAYTERRLGLMHFIPVLALKSVIVSELIQVISILWTSEGTGYETAKSLMCKISTIQSQVTTLGWKFGACRVK
jgi:hypothetical protein